MQADDARVDDHPASMDEEDLIALLELQRLTRELLDQLTAMFPLKTAAKRAAKT